MRKGIGCREVLAAAGLVVALQLLAVCCPGATRRPPVAGADLRGVPAGDRRQPASSGAGADGLPPRPRAPACLEAWVRLRDDRGCPVLAAAAGYRLGLLCTADGWTNGAAVFTGPFPGRAYVSDRPVPQGRWVHLAGLDLGGTAGEMEPPSPGSPAAAPAATPTPECRRRQVPRSEMCLDPLPAAAPATPSAAAIPPADGPLAPPPRPASRLIIAIDGVDVTLGRGATPLGPLPLGYDPWQMHHAAATRGAAGGVPTTSCIGCERLAASHGPPAAPPGFDLGAWRFSRGRSLAEVAAARGTPARLGEPRRLDAGPTSGPPELAAVGRGLPSASGRRSSVSTAGGRSGSASPAGDQRGDPHGAGGRGGGGSSAGDRPGGRITSTGWAILICGWLSVLALTGAGVALRGRERGPGFDHDREKDSGGPESWRREP
jgi:hypothetical protein